MEDSQLLPLAQYLSSGLLGFKVKPAVDVHSMIIIGCTSTADWVLESTPFKLAALLISSISLTDTELKFGMLVGRKRLKGNRL